MFIDNKSDVEIDSNDLYQVSQQSSIHLDNFVHSSLYGPSYPVLIHTDDTL